MDKSAEGQGAVDLRKQLTDLEERVRSLERDSGTSRGIWAERLMYWLIAVGLIVAVILLI
jgi:hypothetical protein